MVSGTNAETRYPLPKKKKVNSHAHEPNEPANEPG